MKALGTTNTIYHYRHITITITIKMRHKTVELKNTHISVAHFVNGDSNGYSNSNIYMF